MKSKCSSRGRSLRFLSLKCNEQRRLTAHVFLSVCVSALLCFSTSAIAESVATPNQFIDAIVDVSKAKCLSLESKNDEAFRDVRSTFCQCYPDRTDALRKRLPKSIQETPIPEGEFVRLYLLGIVNSCAKSLAKNMFGADCAERLSKSKQNSMKYCSCMASYINGISDSEAAQIGLESSKYIPLLAEASKRGEPPPNVPPAFKGFMAMDSICSFK